jgi:hypothetical protein
MIAILAFSILMGFGTNNITVEPNATILDYTQSSTSLTTEGTDLFGGTLGGYFVAPQNWESVQSLGILARVGSNNPNSFFTIELFSGDSLSLVGVYEGTTNTLLPNGPATPITLNLIGIGPGTLSDIRGFQFTWAGEGQPIEFTMENFVDTNPPEPINPKITGYGFNSTGFFLSWSGTGNKPVNVERTTDLRTGPWVTIAKDITTSQYSDPSTPTGPNSKAFYKIVVQ